MRQVSLETADAEVDVCDACGGLWVDWFDGELRAIATETLHASEPRAPNGDAQRRHEPAGRNEPIAAGACPRCTCQLVSERYAVRTRAESTRDDPRASLVGATDAELLRCEACVGAFVSRTSAELLSSLSTSDAPPPSESPGALAPLPWARFVALIKRLLGLG